MLVIISDLHISDGTTSTNVSGSAFTEVLFNEIKSKLLSKTLSEINLILLGDIFDLVRTEYWINDKFNNSDKPWYGTLDGNLINKKPDSHGLYSSEIEYHYNEILKTILETECSKDFKKMILESKNLCVNIPFKVTYVIGNHDRVLNNYDSLKQKILEFLPGIDVEFTNLLSEEVKYKTIARHGHEHDEDNHAYDYYKKFIYPEKLKAWEKNKNLPEPINSRYYKDVYKIQTIGEVVTSELMSGIVYDAKNKITDDPELLRKIYQVNNVRPLEASLDWLVEVSGNTQISDANKKHLAESFSRRLDSLLNSTLADKWDNVVNNSLFNRDLVDSLEIVRSLASGSSLSGIRSKVKIADGINSLLNNFKKAIGIKEKDELEEGAKSDFNLHNNCQYILYGHTHYEKQVNFTATSKNQLHLYVNTGTYLPLVQQSKSDDSFYLINQLSIVFIYMDEEDKTNKEDSLPTIDIWIGKKHKNYKL